MPLQIDAEPTIEDNSSRLDDPRTIMDLAAVIQARVQGVDGGGEMIEAARRLRMLGRPPLVGLALLPQTGQTLSQLSFITVDAGDLVRTEVFHRPGVGGAFRSPVGQLGTPQSAVGPGGA